MATCSRACLRSLPSATKISTSKLLTYRGHGTYVENDTITSSVAGTLERVNKLISVRPLSTRYVPEVGDLVIGRIVEVAGQRWKVEANARQDAVLMLSSVNLPGGVQRRKVESDSLKMREFLAEGDVSSGFASFLSNAMNAPLQSQTVAGITLRQVYGSNTQLLVAEVQAFFSDGAMSLHTRSLKYGKLRNGMLVSLSPRLIRRLKSHFIHLPPPCGTKGVDVILGLNGYVWVSLGSRQGRDLNAEGLESEGVYRNDNDEMSAEDRMAITDVANVIMMLATHDVPLSDTLISEGYAWLREVGVEPGAPGSQELGDRLVRELALTE